MGNAQKYSAGIIALSGCADSGVASVLLGGKLYGEQRLEYSDRQFQHAIRVIRTYQQVFGRRYYIEVQRFSSFERTCVLNPALEKLSRITGALLAATADVHYPYKVTPECSRFFMAHTATLISKSLKLTGNLVYH